ncbi:MAG: amino acid adenylation domain-containing protein, partial [Cyanobacteria bacterium J06558_2]
MTQQDLDLPAWGINHQLSVINLTASQENIESQNKHNLELEIAPQDLAYIIYTSGSTGKPKGVAVQHNSLLNFLYSMQEQPGIAEGDRLLAITTISFDIAGLEIYLPLITGATIVLATKETTIDADQLSRIIAEQDITIIQGTPATWQMLIDNSWQGKPDLKILCGGEALPRKLVLELDSRCKELWNLYGPTETTVWSAIYKFNPDDNPELNTVAIGKAVANTEFYILDSQLNLVPKGRAGELYIGGDGLARGYLHRGDLTAERFIPFSLNSKHLTFNIDERPRVPQGHNIAVRRKTKAFLFAACTREFEHLTVDISSSTSDTRLYKTGDRVRQLPNGNLEYLGRLDNQVKIRGFRIELGEIEAALNQYPEIKASVVTPRQESLIAYIIANLPTASAKIRSYLADKLPSYMIPGDIIQVESFPLTPNGKIDRRALSLRTGDRQETQSIIAAQSPTEEILISIWTEILERDVISTQDNFFELGGHSLLATRVVSQIRQIFSIELSLRTLFEHPTIKDLALAVEQQQNKNNSTKNPVVIEIVNRDGELPLSFAQQRQWFIHQLEPDNPWYNISTAIKITGSLDIPRLQQCFDILLARQEILRTSFLTIAGKPQIVINDNSKINLSVIDLSSLSKLAKQQQAKQIQIADARQPFDLERSPLMRVKLIKLSNDEQVLLLSLHHIIGDGWSMGVLVKEIVGLYVDPPALSRTPLKKGGWGGSIQYLDYAAWQRKYLQGEVLDRQVSYWRSKLANAPAISSIATDAPRKPQSSYESGAYYFQINQRITQSLKQIGRRNSGTLFITLLSALALLLHRYTDQDDLVIGTPIANRDRAEVAGLIGFFANTLALRVNLADNPTFTELLARARETALEAYSHQDLPFEQLIDSLQLERSLSYSPLFQVMLVLEEQSNQLSEVSGLTWQPLERVTTQAKFELTFSIKDTEKGLQGAIEYNKALFTADTMHRFAGHFRTLLIAIAKNPEASISDISILNKGELKQVVEKFNQSNQVTIDSCIHELFERQVQQTPDAIAVIDDHQAITYRELSDRANGCASYLQSLGVNLETKVGIMSDRSLNTVVALLAILKAGGCYVPLDPNYPQERINFILQDTNTSILLIETKYAEQLDNSNLTLINLDSPVASPASLAPAASTPNNLAYITYTSGSTGTPKGVAIPHRGVVRLVQEPNYIELDQDTRILHAAPLAFDASTLEIWGALLNGGRLVILNNPVPSLEELGAIIIQQEINTLWLTAGLFRLMVDQQLEAFRDVRQLLAGGDVLSARHIQQFLQAHPQCSLINGYGPTETTTFACCYPMDQDTEIDNRSIIGYPISNTQLYILDKYLNPLPVGVAGELHIAGEGLARGYLNHAELTADKFISNPVGEHRDAPLQWMRIYKTGDRVKYLSDGRIEYLGRIDNQVKIRGFRVELGEIEATLNGLEGIKDSVVLVKENASGNKQLAAYIIPDDLVTNQEDNWRRLLKNKLPDYLIPSFLIPCESFPLTSNGKIDRQALLAKGIIIPETLEDSLLASTDLEHKLVEIWSKVLNLETVNTNSNFFSLGGDSILAIQIVADANQAGIKITPRQLFENQTIAELAEVASTEITNTAEQGLVTGSISLTPIQEWFFELNLANINHFNQSVLLETKQDLDLDTLQASLEKLLTHHDALRIKFTPTEAGWQQYNSEQIVVVIEQIGLDNLSGEEQSKLIIEECDRLQSSLDITNNLIKVAY